ncbi:aldehyde dehydrogenase [Verminephrobacter aporrectodeae subsp. tuberculatae]|uniref:aldehyde dehydrogenase n=1 Tax=Verminephrobacter aporrectodeae TaxID=1110389 RepID=UPI002238E55F|nr:aldehyde dehydrogenase [Verminephrobacter aporrectodeae]MCW5222182.1 aldehyde dehydrogenase [Verminephrobacter aporrectodeae subsp. tuberculatae]MCW5287646.1 aldehyde dehydrogenase [Verminephrobacter aporrectodeae subsp. tuberculatae]MCW8166883.1 aldehyde dehydrogenase [Verminephrobacter aporrectodeae subsp. tuberculatae]MCW8168658.1 aldehyde dehydrogenase [Verminephrobacter aporrectodeae subsp. tuberculatae]
MPIPEPPRFCPPAPAGAGPFLLSINPADGSQAGRVAQARAADVDGAVARAWQAVRCQPWRDLRLDRRADVLYEIGRLLRAEREPLARLQMADSGKPWKECLHMVDSAAGSFRYYAAVCETLQGEITPARGEYFSMAIAEPFGVIAAITPWNSPIMNEAQKVAPALAAGNAVVLKPSEETPQLALELLRVCHQAGLPQGLLQVLNGSGEEVGAALVRHPGVRMLSFTGGTETGRAIAAVAGQRLIPVGLELGGKSPHIVCADADREAALAGVLSGIFGSAGQSCVAGSRLFVERAIYAEFVAALAQRTRALRVGLPDDPGTQVGPLISWQHRDKVAGYVELGRREGARVLAGGYAPEQSALARGAFYMPTLLDGLHAQARVCQEEIFGPVLVALPFDGEDDLIEQANGTAFGLAAGIWTGSYPRAWRLARALEAGSVWINTYKQSHIATPFGGFKDSGIGREKGLQGLRLYSQNKSIYWGLHTQPLSLG